MLMKAERQELIVDRVQTTGRVVVADIAQELGVTRDTIRKDLQELSRIGAVQRVHGGAVGADEELTRFDWRRRLWNRLSTTVLFSLTAVPRIT